MNRTQKVFWVVAVLFVAMGFLLPLWSIDIWAPQYPEGLSMQIGVKDITGNVAQVNILNHYIGMKKIEPHKMLEMIVMPVILGFLIALGLLAGVLGSRKLGHVWLIAFALLALGGLVDFYRWGYNYGHDLDPEAPIKVPGMTYQPPLIGCKTLLNIQACSLPDSGGYVVALAFLLGVIVLTWDKIAYPRTLSRLFCLVTSKKSQRLMSLLSIIFVLGCTSDSIQLNHDSCDNCKMLISNDHFGALAMTEKGRVLRFDSISCLLSYLAKNHQSIKSISVVDFMDPGHLVSAEKANFLINSRVEGPMGPGPVASLNKKAMENLQAKKSGEIVNWNSVFVSSLH